MKSLIVNIILIVFIIVNVFAQNLNLIKEIKFGKDITTGALIIDDAIYIHGGDEYQTTVWKLSHDGDKEWIFKDRTYEFNFVLKQNMISIDSSLIFQSIPILQGPTITFRINKRDGKITWEDTTVTTGVLSSYNDTIVIVNDSIYLYTKDFHLIRKFPAVFRMYGLVTTKVYENYIYVSGNTGMYGTYIVKYRLEDGGTEWIFFTPDNDTLKSFRIVSDIDGYGNVYCFGNKLVYPGTFRQYFFIYKVSSDGKLEWYKEFLPSGEWRKNWNNWANAIKVVKDTMIFAGGAVEKNNLNGYEFYLILFKNNGKVVLDTSFSINSDEKLSEVSLIGNYKNYLIVIARTNIDAQTNPGYIIFYDISTSDSTTGGVTDTTSIGNTDSSRVDTTKNIPKNYLLYQNYPNPFNSQTTIEFDLPEKVNVKLVVYNVLGQEVAVLVDGEMNEGKHRVKFDAGNLPSGVYIYELRSGRYRSVKKMVLMK